jgi:hypothetical protein
MSFFHFIEFLKIITYLQKNGTVIIYLSRTEYTLKSIEN